MLQPFHFLFWNKIIQRFSYLVSIPLDIFLQTNLLLISTPLPITLQQHRSIPDISLPLFLNPFLLLPNHLKSNPNYSNALTNI